MAEREKELKSLLMKMKEIEKAVLKLTLQQTKIMASNPITSWQIDGETVTDFFFLGSKITADDDYNHERKKKCLLFWKNSYDKPRHHLKSRDITLLTKFRLVKPMVFAVVMCECENWTIKVAED